MRSGPLYCESERIAIIAQAVVNASNEHGVPNSFSAGWLSTFNLHGAYFTPMQVGRHASDVVTALRVKGWDITYSDRSFRIEKGGEGYDD